MNRIQIVERNKALILRFGEQINGPLAFIVLIIILSIL